MRMICFDYLLTVRASMSHSMLEMKERLSWDAFMFMACRAAPLDETQEERLSILQSSPSITGV